MTEAQLRILIAGELGSSHFRRWCAQLANTGWDVHLLHTGQSLGFPQSWYEGFTIHTPYVHPDVIIPGFEQPPHWYDARPFPLRIRRHLLRHALDLLPHRLPWVLSVVRPHVVHSHGLNINWRNNLLPVHKVLSRLPRILRPCWLYSTWGADLDFFPNLGPDHEAGVRRVLPLVDALVTECERDHRLAREFGFDGEFFGKVPMFGGISEQVLAQGTLPAADRRLLLIKGRDATPPGGDPVGRAGAILDALEHCLPQLSGWSIVVLQATSSIRDRVARLTAIGLDIRAPAHFSDHEAVLALFARARAFISMTINDGLPSSLVEAMALGALPIHSHLASIAEWIRHGKNGLLTGAEDVPAIVDAITRAVTDVTFVEAATVRNRELVRMHLDAVQVKARVLEIYRQAAVMRHQKRGL